MKYLTALENLEDKLNSLVYSRPGGGKTTFGLSHPYPVIVDPGEQGYQTVLEPHHRKHKDVPVIEIESYEDLEDVVYDTDKVMAEFQQAKPEWADYPYKSFIFENLNLLQELVLGKASKVDPTTKKIIRPATGIMALPNKRDVHDIPGMKDFNSLSRKTKDFFKGVRNMPYHTVLTVHAGLYESEESPKGLRVDPTEKILEGFPNLYGQLRWVGGGLVDLYMYLERRQVGNTFRYFAHTRPHKKFEARSKISSRLPTQIEWTDKSLFEFIKAKIDEALCEAKGKGAVG